jgi:PadR family transcriptional regulator PadR
MEKGKYEGRARPSNEVLSQLQFRRAYKGERLFSAFLTYIIFVRYYMNVDYFSVLIGKIGEDIVMSKRAPDETAIRLSALEEDLLTLLVGRELYGLEIIEATKTASGGQRSIGVGSLYPTLHKMEKKGLVRSWWGEETPEERGHARRRYYTVTGFGERVLAATQQRRLGLAQCQPAWGRA